MGAWVQLSKRAQKDLRRLNPVTRQRALDALAELAARPPKKLDVVALDGRAPWRRLRFGDFRIIFRPLGSQELRARGRTEKDGMLVERIVDRRDLERAVRAL